MDIFLDYTTLLFLLPATFIASAIVIFFVHLQHKEIAGTREWALAMFLVALGCSLQVNRHAIPTEFSILLANALILAGDGFLLIGIMRYVGQTINWPFLLFIFSLIWLPFFYTYDSPELFAIRSHLVDICITLVCIVSVYYLRKEIKKERISAYLIIIASFCGIAFSSTLRSGALLTSNLYPEIGLTTQTIVATFYTLLILFFLTLTAGLTMLVSERLRRNLALALEKDKQTMLEQNNFWAMVSHEFKTPLSTIINSANLIELAANKNPQTIETESLRIQRASSRLASLVDKCLINDWLEVATTERKHDTIDIVNMLQNLSFEYNIAFKNDLPLGTCIQGDPYLLPVAFSSLIDNALKYSNQKENCYFTAARQANGSLIFKVFDDGDGVDEKDMPHLFEKFFRSDKHHTKNGGGYGLYITQKIANLHNAKVGMHREDGMTAFTLTFPRHHPL
ncbi:sensor histidine kinase [Terasakiella pusilla]|uniref:sensor histidine kinase n=1 Tax=Terasakiella pusilla TaxID=64973 RepID=UPI00048D5695|nr:HAMP domain-containing sensor histidine kinase [Terasakiella pusilla]